jgi:hypothetical protein
MGGWFLALASDSWQQMGHSDPIRIVKGSRRKSLSQSPFTIQSFTSHLGLLYVAGLLGPIMLPSIRLTRLEEPDRGGEASPPLVRLILQELEIRLGTRRSFAMLDRLLQAAVITFLLGLLAGNRIFLLTTSPTPKTPGFSSLKTTSNQKPALNFWTARQRSLPGNPPD